MTALNEDAAYPSCCSLARGIGTRVAVAFAKSGRSKTKLGIGKAKGIGGAREVAGRGMGRRLFVISLLAETERKLCILTFGFVVLFHTK